MIGDNIMLAVPVADSYEYNIEYDLYSARDKKEYGYIGLYRNKAVRAVGKVTKVVVVKDVNGELEFESAVTEDEKNRVLEYKRRYEHKKRTELNESDYVFGKEPRKVFFVDHFYETNLENTNKVVVLRGKKIELDDDSLLPTIPVTTKEIADGLRGKTIPPPPPPDKIMLAVPVSVSYDIDVETNSYCDAKKQIYGYLGLYKDKSISAVGKVIKVVKLEKKDNDWSFNIVLTKREDYVTEDEKEIIFKRLGAPPNDDCNGLKIFFVDKFHKTDYQNTGTQGIVGGKRVLLHKILPANTEEIAYHLYGRKFKLEPGKDLVPKRKSSAPPPIPSPPIIDEPFLDEE